MCLTLELALKHPDKAKLSAGNLTPYKSNTILSFFALETQRYILLPAIFSASLNTASR